MVSMKQRRDGTAQDYLVGTQDLLETLEREQRAVDRHPDRQSSSGSNHRRDRLDVPRKRPSALAFWPVSIL